MSMIVKIVPPLVACVACLICSGTGYGWGKDVMNKSTDTKKIENERNSTIAFCVIMMVFLLISWVMSRMF